MKPKTLLVLAVVVALLGAFVWFFERDLPGSGERAEQAKKVLGGLESKDVETVDIAWGDRRVHLEKVRPTEKEEASDSAGNQGDSSEEDSGDIASDVSSEPDAWRLTEPRAARADASEVSSLLDRLVSLEKRRTVDDADRAALGLDPPEVAVTLATGSGERELQVGSKVPISDDRFVALGEGSEVFLAAGTIYDELVRDPNEWRDHRIFAADRDDVTRVELSSTDRDEEVVLTRDGEAFRLESPFRDRADREQVRTLMDRLVGLRAQSFVEERADGEAAEGSKEGTDLGLDPPRAVLTASLGSTGGETVRLEIGAVLDEGLGRRYGRFGDQVFVFQNKELMEDALRPADEWRSPRWSGLQVFRIDSMHVRDEQGELTVTRSGSDWQRGEDRIPYTAVSDLLYAVTESEAERFLSEAEARAAGWSLDAPTHTLTLQAEGAADETLTLYPPVEEGVPARAGDREPVLLLPLERRTALEEALTGVREAEPIPDEGEDGGAEDPVDDVEILTEEGSD